MGQQWHAGLTLQGTNGEFSLFKGTISRVGHSNPCCACCARALPCFATKMPNKINTLERAFDAACANWVATKEVATQTCMRRASLAVQEATQRAMKQW